MMSPRDDLSRREANYPTALELPDDIESLQALVQEMHAEHQRELGPGMVAFGPDGNLVGEGDCYAQAIRVYQNVAAVLALEGRRRACRRALPMRGIVRPVQRPFPSRSGRIVIRGRGAPKKT